MNAAELIGRKRDGGRLTGAEIGWLVAEFTAGRVPDYQMAAWLMAARIRELDREETAALTDAMMRSGRLFDLADIPGPKVDKHSTGGVGDKVSLVLAPIVAAAGVRVPMVSGRSLGHTGGTLDKLESIPGFRTDLSFARFKRVLGTVGAAMVGQSDELCPADRKMYALRDVTATVDSIPLIAASIMSKKLAEGAEALVLDVKTGSGAFMKGLRQARRLAAVMIGIGTRLGRRVSALVTDMSQPLGRAVGNSVEVVEAIEALKGNWPGDLWAVTSALAEEMLVLSGKRSVRTRQRAQAVIDHVLRTGQALRTFGQIVRAQGGDLRVVDDYRLLPRPARRARVRAARSGFVAGIDALEVGRLGLELGIGRKTTDSAIDPAAGFRFLRKTGEAVGKGEVIAEVQGSNPKAVSSVSGRLGELIRISTHRVRVPPLILGRVRPGN